MPETEEIKVTEAADVKETADPEAAMENIIEEYAKYPTLNVKVEGADGEKSTRNLSGKSVFALGLTEDIAKEEMLVNIGLMGVWNINAIVSAISNTIIHFTKVLKGKGVSEAQVLDMVMHSIRIGMEKGFDIDVDHDTQEDVATKLIKTAVENFAESRGEELPQTSEPQPVEA